MNNGTIMILGPDTKLKGENNLAKAKKVFEIKITNTFPIISNGSNSIEIEAKNKKVNINGYQHLSIPPDLQIHLTGSKKSPGIYFDVDILNKDSTLKNKLIHLFSWKSMPISTYKEIRESKKPKYHQALLLFIASDQYLDFSKNTGIFIELFIHQSPNDLEKINEIPIQEERGETMTVINLCKFAEIIRGKNFRNIPDCFLSARIGFFETTKNHTVLKIPFDTRSPLIPPHSK